MTAQEPAEVQLTTMLERQRAAFLAEGTPDTDVRRARLQSVIDVLVDRHLPLVAAMDEDFGGRAPSFSIMNDVLGSLGALKYARDAVDGWMADDERPAYAPYDQLGARAEVRHQPKGSVGIIGTWNAPVYTLLAPLASVLAAGNRAILKPSEVAPLTAAVLAEAFAELVDPAVVGVVTGGPDVAATFSRARFNHLVFTGSTHIGRIVMANAAENLVPVTLELGGKSPTVVSRSADLATVAHHIAMGKVANGGQLCINPDLVHLPRERMEEFIDEMKRQYADLVPTVDANPDVVAAVNDRHLARVDGYVEDAVGRDVRVEVTPLEETGTSRRRPLRIVVDPPADAAIQREEIFGSAVVVLPYDTVDEVIADVNARPNPLALYYFGEDDAEREQVLAHTLSGGVTINAVMMHPGMAQAPFGGVGASGMGHYNGYEGFLEFSHARTVFHAPDHDVRGEWGMLPPHGEGYLEMMASQVTR